MNAPTPAHADAGFETTRPGTDENIWRPWLEEIPEWMPARSPIVIVAPHPDDETFGAGGLMSLCARRGDPVVVICVTDGEAARPEKPGLGAIRMAELMAASRHLLGESPQVERLGISDGEVAHHERELSRRLELRIPSGATLVAPFEHDGHTDHDATGRVCIELAAKLGLTLARYPIWAWHRLRPDALSGEKAVKVALDERSRTAKDAAISRYGSQTEDRAGGAIVPEHVLTYFRRNHEVYFL